MAGFEPSVFTVDRAATARAYAADRPECDCAYCRNFRAARSEIFPAGFLALLDELGVDQAKAAEVWEAPSRTEGHHLYAGWYHFAGQLRAAGTMPEAEFGPGFSASLRPWAGEPRLAGLDGLDVVALHFACEAVPWVLDEPDPS